MGVVQPSAPPALGTFRALARKAPSADRFSGLSRFVLYIITFQNLSSSNAQLYTLRRLLLHSMELSSPTAWFPSLLEGGACGRDSMTPQTVWFRV